MAIAEGRERQDDDGKYEVASFNWTGGGATLECLGL